MAENYLEKLDERLESLEKLVYGRIDRDSPALTSVKLCDNLNHVNNRINSALVGRNKLSKAFKRIDEIDSCMNPEFLGSIDLSDSAKFEIVVSQEPVIQEMTEKLKLIESLTFVLDSEHIKGAPLHSEKIRDLSIAQIKQLEKVEDLSEQCKELLTSYNNAILTVSKLFVKWDQDLAKFELASQPKKMLS